MKSLIYILALAIPAITLQAHTISTTPAKDGNGIIVVLKEENVTFTASGVPSGDVVTLELDVPGDQKYSGKSSVVVPFNSEPTDAQCTLTVSHTTPGKNGGPVVTCTTGATFPYRVIVPKVEIIDTNVEDDKITFKCTPSGLSGTLKLELDGDQKVEIYNASVTGSDTEKTESFHIEDKLTDAVKDKTFKKINAVWSPSNKQAKHTKNLNKNFVYLGKWTISNYFTPQESGYSGSVLSKGTGALNGTVWSGVTNVAHPIAFMNAVDPANEGLGLIGTTVVRFHSTYGNTTATPWTLLNGGAPTYLANPNPSQQTASCSPHNLIGNTDGYAAISPKLGCGDEVIIQDVGKKKKIDIGGGLGSTQIDVYIGEGGTTLNQQANTWGKKTKWVIKLQ